MRWVQPDTVIPNLYNPLDFDRYQYVRSNPVNFTDPTGHFTCEDSSDGCDREHTTWKPAPLTTDQKRVLIATMASVIQANVKDSLQAFSQLVDYASTLYKQDDSGNFMSDLDCVINGYCAGNNHLFPMIGIPLGQGGPSWIRMNFFKGKGSWSSLYYDYSDNQMYHFWFYAGLTYFDGSNVGTFAVGSHDPPSSQWVTSTEMDEALKGNSYQDYLLGLAGVQMGMLIQDGELKINEISNWIIINLGEPNGPH